MKLNKYQEVLGFFKKLTYRVPLKCATDEFCKKYDENLSIIKELVEKATPIKPKYEADGYANGELVYDTAYCPNCGKYYERDYGNWGHSYCPKCGQAIDWSE